MLGILTLLLTVAGVIMYCWKKSHPKAPPNTQHQPELSASNTKKRFCFIINPSKPGANDAVRLIEHVCKRDGISDYSIKETTVEHPGNLQAKEAIEEGSEVIVACGGDGTVRSVACQVAKYADKEQEVEVGILPLGTGNILARNLNIPLDDLAAALDICLRASSSPLDLGFVKLLEQPDFEHVFTIIAGVGFDADMINNTSDKLKSRISWFAYFASGLKSLSARKVKARIIIEKAGGGNLEASTKLRTIMVGNVGKIPWFSLIPDAKYDDGILDVVAIDTQAGILGWSQLAIDVMLQKLSIKNNMRYKLGRIEHVQASWVQVKLDRQRAIQLDGDIIGKTSGMQVFVRKAAIQVRKV
ncbi:MAG: diacylglycerol kinase [Candidatus Ancillula sp.]|nr:diacylglycerol kinase [Candidatus Ancillula sp.]